MCNHSGLSSYTTMDLMGPLYHYSFGHRQSLFDWKNPSDRAAKLEDNGVIDGIQSK